MKTIDLSTYDNSWYHPGTSKVWILVWIVVSTLFVRNPMIVSMTFKKMILRAFGAKIGKGVWVKPGVHIKYPWLLEIGDNCWIGENVWIDNLAKVTIGNHVVLSQGAMLLCGNHNYKKVGFDLMVGEIKLDNGVWIGARSIVCGEVTCQSHAILTVNSVLTQVMEPYSIYTGNPAIKIRQRRIV